VIRFFHKHNSSISLYLFLCLSVVMHYRNALLFASTSSAIAFPSVDDISSRIRGVFHRRDNSCPDTWNKVSGELTTMFLTNGQCNDDARAAIRLNFHECGSWETKLGATGGCDGSIILAGELGRPENKGLTDIAHKVQNLANKYGTGIGGQCSNCSPRFLEIDTSPDMIVFAGSHATVTCPGGPVVKTWIGRKDSSVPAPDGLLPDVQASADTLFTLFQNKGFSDVDLAALLGAHSVSKQFFVDQSRAGQPQDSTPGVWDVKYYSETTSPVAGDFVFPSDAKLAAHAVVGKQFKGFVNNQGKWNGKYADAMGRMNLFGVASTNGMVDCTSALPKSTNIKREMRAMPVYGRTA
jgi:hypothetical protein